MNVLDLFSGIGGFSLGLERAGMRTVAFCESDEYCRAVLRRHWPDVPVWDDVRTLTFHEGRLAADTIKRRILEATEVCAGREGAGILGSTNEHQCTPVYIDVICGGFPCQDISVAGKGAGIAGERSILWKEFARIIGEVRPRYIIVENVAALLGRGLSVVLGDLAALGYDAEWHCIPACAVGAPHRRDRVWIVAYPGCGNGNARQWATSRSDQPGSNIYDQRCSEDVAHAARHVRGEQAQGGTEWQRTWQCGQQSDVAYAGDQGQLQQSGIVGEERGRVGNGCEDVAYADGRRCEQRDEGKRSIPIINPQNNGQSDWWLTEPDVGRVAHGVPARVDRLRALGNSLVPQIAEMIGRAIMAAEKSR
jgi:DNA (cytosine-5)-methyltransferase 1